MEKLIDQILKFAEKNGFLLDIKVKSDDSDVEKIIIDIKTKKIKIS